MGEGDVRGGGGGGGVQVEEGVGVGEGVGCRGGGVGVGGSLGMRPLLYHIPIPSLISAVFLFATDHV